MTQSVKKIIILLRILVLIVGVCLIGLLFVNPQQQSVSPVVLDPYKILKISGLSSQSQIRSQFRILSKQHHPDKVKSITSPIKFSQITSAFQLFKEFDFNHLRVKQFLKEQQERKLKNNKKDDNQYDLGGQFYFQYKNKNYDWNLLYLNTKDKISNSLYTIFGVQKLDQLEKYYQSYYVDGRPSKLLYVVKVLKWSVYHPLLFFIAFFITMYIILNFCKQTNEIPSPKYQYLQQNQQQYRLRRVQIRNKFQEDIQKINPNRSFYKKMQDNNTYTKRNVANFKVLHR